MGQSMMQLLNLGMLPMFIKWQFADRPNDRESDRVTLRLQSCTASMSLLRASEPKAVPAPLVTLIVVLPLLSYAYVVLIPLCVLASIRSFMSSVYVKVMPFSVGLSRLPTAS